jgi:signal transduction histidine kinase
MDGFIRNKISWPQFWGLLVLTLLIFGAVILLISIRLRGEIREQIVGRDGEILTAVASMLHSTVVEEIFWEPEGEGTDILGTILQTSRLRGVLGVQIFDHTGSYVGSVPFGLAEGRLTAEERLRLQRFEPSSTYRPSVDLVERYGFPARERAIRPMLEVAVPVFAREARAIDGVAVFIMDGEEIAQEFAALDRGLFLQAGLAFSIGGLLFAAVAVSGFTRLRQTQAMLIERSSRLLQANQELALLAKTSAVGALTAHLIHGLKNPLAGLDEHLSALAGGEAGEEDWRQASAAARRMRELINDVVGILRDDGQAGAYSLTLSELGDLVSDKVAPTAKAAGVVFTSFLSGEETLGGREANITALILVNLLENGLEASQPGQEVTVRVRRTEGRFLFEVGDQGPGIPSETREKLFLPGQSTRRGGTGLGLAISHLLARHIGATLQLKKSDENGTVFALTLVPANEVSPDAARSEGVMG